MEQRGAETGTEFILDNRKLIIGFMLLIIVCGVFFVIGFMEGKRQAIEAHLQALIPASPNSSPVDSEPGSATVPPKSAQAEDRSAKEGLDWYKNLQSGMPGAKKEGGTSGGAATSRGQKDAAPIPKVPKPEATPPSGTAAPQSGAGYWVQVGAFTKMREAEIVIASLKAKGYEATIVNPSETVQHYLVKVGDFASRAEAVAMQLKLKKDGFSGFVKTN